MNRRGPLAAIAALVGVTVCSGCIMPDQFAQIQKDVADVHARVQRVEQEQAAARARQQELADAASRPADAEQVTPEDLADLNFRVDQTTRETASANARLVELRQRLERLAQEVDRRLADPGPSRATPASGAGSGLSPDVSADGSVQNADDLYNTAYADFSKGNYDLAIAGFLEFHDTYPDSPQADNALYWVGECNFSQGDFSRAIQAFDRLLELYPQSDKAASGDLKKGLAYLEQNQVAKAIVQLQHVHDTYAGTDEARVARDRLSALGVSI